MPSLLDRCIFNASAGGTADFTVSSAYTGYLTPLNAGAVHLGTYHYAAQTVNITGTVLQWEVGLGTYNDPVLSRTTILFSSNSNSIVNFSTAPTVMISALAEDIYPKTNAISVNLNSVDQTGMANSTFNKVKFNNKAFDPDGVFDAVTNYRYTPNIAGKFLIIANVGFNPNSGALDDAVACIYRNGSNYAQGNEFLADLPTGENISFWASHVSCIVDMNGSTDYIEIFGYAENDNSDTNIITGEIVQTYFTAQRLGP